MPWSTLAGFLGIHTHLVHLEKPEMLVSARLRTRCMMSVSSLRNVSGREEKARICEKSSLCTTVSSWGHGSVTSVYRIFLWSSSSHRHVTSSCFPTFCVCLSTCLCGVCWVHSWSWFNAFIYIPQCLQPVTGLLCEGKMRLPFFLQSQFWSHNTQVWLSSIFPISMVA